MNKHNPANLFILLAAVLALSGLMAAAPASAQKYALPDLKVEAPDGWEVKAVKDSWQLIARLPDRDCAIAFLFMDTENWR